MELVLTATVGVCIGSSHSPEVLIFKQFQGQGSAIDEERYVFAFSDDFASSELIISVFCEQQLQDQPPRDD